VTKRARGWRSAGVAAAVVCSAAVATAPAQSIIRSPERLQVVAKEYELGPSRYTLRAGDSLIELVNSGEDDHDLALRRSAPRARTIHVSVVRPGAIRRLAANLAPGRYTLWCTLPGHRAAGMQALLTVRP
jgi:plastocyanin